MTFRRYGEKAEISQNLMDAIAVHMDGEIREAVHFDLAPCSPEKFLAEYIRRDPSFEELLKTEFSLEPEA